MDDRIFLNLEEPILIVGHVNPDADVISSASCLLNYLDDNDKECIFGFKGVFPTNLAWIIPEGLITDRPEDVEYNSLIVLDCLDSAFRLGFEKKDVKTIVLDHHDSSFGVKDTKNTKYIIADCPSTSAILYEKFKFDDPIIYVGLFFDSINRLVNIKKTSDIISKLDIDDTIIGEYHRNLEQKKSLDSLEFIRSSNIISYETDDFVYAAISGSFDLAGYFDIQNLYSKYFDIFSIYNSSTNLINLYSKFGGFKCNEFASKFGGGGSKNFAGIKVANFQSYEFILLEMLKELGLEMNNEN